MGSARRHQGDADPSRDERENGLQVVGPLHDAWPGTDVVAEPFDLLHQTRSLGSGERVDVDFALTNVTIYWLTGTIASAMRIYREFHIAEPVAREPTTVPLGLAMFTNDFTSIRTLADRDHANIVSWNVYDGDGHWGAHQAPDVYLHDVRTFFAGLRTDIDRSAT